MARDRQSAGSSFQPRACGPFAAVDWQLDTEDRARLVTGFRGQPRPNTPAMRYSRRAVDGIASAYVVDDESGMVYLID